MHKLNIYLYISMYIYSCIRTLSSSCHAARTDFPHSFSLFLSLTLGNTWCPLVSQLFCIHL